MAFFTDVIAEWQKRTLDEQIFAVVRHAERADGAFSFTGGERWTQTPDFDAWPLDPPLSDEGLVMAGRMGKRIKEFTDKSDAHIHVVVSSPYTRCMQTAAAICEALGSATRLLVDNALGEVYGPKIMGPNEPMVSCRPLEEMPRNGLKKSFFTKPKVVGKHPSWPEDLKMARQRYAHRFLTYLQRSATTKRNFILVTHGDCVGSSLSVMPSHAEKIVEKIEYGGMFLARRSSPASAAKLLGGFLAASGWAPQEGASEPNSPTAGINPDKETFDDMKAPDGWTVETVDIRHHDREEGSKDFGKRAKALSKGTSLSQEQIGFLLGALHENSLGDDVTALSHISESTMIFGESVADNPSIGCSEGSLASTRRRSASGKAPVGYSDYRARQLGRAKEVIRAAEQGEGNPPPAQSGQGGVKKVPLLGLGGDPLADANASFLKRRAAAK